MENLRIEDFVTRFDRLEADIESGAIRSEAGILEARASIKEIRDLTSEYEKSVKAEFRSLEGRVYDLDRDLVEQKTLYETINYRLDHMDKRISDLESIDTTTRDKRNDLYEKILMAVLGGIISYIFSSLI